MARSVSGYHPGYNPALWEIKNSFIFICLINLLFLEQKCDYRKDSKANDPFYQSPNLPHSSGRFTDIVKNLDLGNKIPFLRNLKPFSVPLRRKCSAWSSLGAQSHLLKCKLQEGNSYQKKKKRKTLFGNCCLVTQSIFWLFVTPQTVSCQTSLSLTISQSLPKFLSIAISDAIQSPHPLMPSPLLSFFPNIREFSNEEILKKSFP